MKHYLLILFLMNLAPLATAESSQPDAPTYTFVIVHGSTAGAWEWKRVGEYLSRGGHTVYRVTLTGLGERWHLASPEIDLETHIMDVVNTIRFEDLHDVVLTGHSYGGMVITGVMDRIPERIKHVIFLDAFVPEDGESLYDITGGPRPNSRVVDGMWSFPGQEPKDTYPQNTPQSEMTFRQPVSYDNPKAFDLPVTYVAFLQEGQVAGRDGLSALGWKRARDRGWTLRTFPGHHVAQMVNPEGLADLMVEAVSMDAGDEEVTADGLNVMSFNIRYGRADDGEDSWEFRKDLVMDVIKQHQPDLLGLQEALQFQLDAVLEEFPQFASIGIGRDPGGEGEYAAILYRRERFEEVDSGTFWLSDTPEVPSTHWGNKHLRICTWARLLDKRTGDHLYFYNTHFDHQSQHSREKSAVLLAGKISAREHRDPVIVTGDFNAGEENPAITYLSGRTSPLGKPPVQLVDTYGKLFPGKHPAGTFNAFKGENNGERIDYIFVSPVFRLLEVSIIRDSVDGRYPSDHYPVSARIVLSRD